jgi:hypothetical protein
MSVARSVGIDVKAINLRDAATDWRGSSQGLAALRDSGPVKDRNGSISTEATAAGKRVDVGCWRDSSGPFHRRRFVGQCHNRS